MIEGLSITMNIYVCCYLALLFSVIVIILLKKREFNFLTQDYFKFLFTKERFCIYCLGTIALLLPAHFLEIHSWDYAIAIFQPILAYITAPWSVEVLCKLEKSKAKLSETFAALNMMMFTGSWSVELYLLYRDGYYMPDWLVNIPIGIVCFLVMGTLWNADWTSKST